MMNALVTGGAGFIGSHLVRELLARSYEVTVIDDLSTGSIRNIEDLLGRDDFDFIEGDVRRRQLLAPLMEKADYCYHLAAAVGVKRIVDEPLSSLEALVHGTCSVLEQADRWQVPLFLSSTSEVYGKRGAQDMREDTPSLIGPVARWRWLYACAKMLDEFWALAYHRENGLPVVVARLFNVSGPRQTGRWGMVIPTFVSQALADDPITVYGDGTQKRCFLHVTDCVEAIMRLTECQEAIGRVVNIGSTHEFSINELAKRVLRLVPGSRSQIAHISYENAYAAGFEDVRERKPDTALLESLTGFEPQFTLDDIISDICEYSMAGAASPLMAVS